MVNQLNLDLWIEDLRTTTAPQIQRLLAQQVDKDGTIGFCCLGRGCEVAGIHRDTNLDDDEDEDFTNVEFYYDDAQELPPVSFHDWLGLDLAHQARDIYPDWPMEQVPGRPHLHRGSIKTRGGSYMDWSCASLNDDVHLTFAQIGDVLAYFGVRNG